ncbi:MAG: GTPase [Pirellulales bacterium]
MASSNETFVYPLTPPGRAALASLAVCGPTATSVIDPLFLSALKRPLSQAPPNRILFGHWLRPDGEEVVVVARNKHYVEIHGHGGARASEAIVTSLRDAGAKVGSWQDWLAKSADHWIGRAAQQALVDARTERTARILLDQWQGALAREIRSIVQWANSDDHARAVRGIDRLLSRAKVGRRLTDPFRVVLTGPSNAGKSSLINAIVGYRRSIVAAQPGTTRDIISATSAIDGWPVVFSDTAGVRRESDALEAAGMALAAGELASADLQLLVFDRAAGWNENNNRLVAAWIDGLVVHNKCDLPPNGDARPQGVAVSATQGDHLNKLLDEIVRKLVPITLPRGAAVPFTDEQIAKLSKARVELLDGTLAAANRLLQPFGAAR